MGIIETLKADPSTDALANGFTRRQIATTLTPRMQELILLPTEKCNLRCSYCYEDFSIGKMSETTQRAIELFLERRVPDLKVLRFSWFGGEPLVAKAIVLRLSRFAKALCDEHGVAFNGGLTTNGYLLDKAVFEHLLDCGQDFYQITLDGWGDSHDAVRKFADGRGTFDRIWANLLAMKTVERPFEILLRVHIRRENIDEMPAFMERLGQAFGDDHRFRLDFEHVRNLGGEGGAAIRQPVSLTEVRAIEGRLRGIYDANAPGAADRAPAHEETPAAMNRDVIVEAVQAAKMVGESAGGQRAEDIALGGNYICYASKANSLLVRANGRIGKCTVALYDEANDIGYLKPDGSVAIDNAKLQPWLRGLETLDINTLGCPFAGLGQSA